MNKIIIKFTIALCFLINTFIIVVFYPNYIPLLEPYLFPVFFIYFILDSFSIIFPFWNNDIYSSKMTKRMYIERENYNIETLKAPKKRNNIKALIIFMLYVSMIISIAFLYNYFSWFNRGIIYLLFFGINLGDYFCILIWCPFRELFLKNTCCNTCRISNWDRLMKVSILLIIPNFYTLTINVIALVIFLYWEYQHQFHTERFYRVSNKRLLCSSCNIKTCKTKKGLH